MAPARQACARGIGELDAAILVAVAMAANGLSASELLAVVDPAVLRGSSLMSRARRASAVMTSLAGSGLLVRNAGRTTRYSITRFGLDTLRACVEPSLVGAR